MDVQNVWWKNKITESLEKKICLLEGIKENTFKCGEFKFLKTKNKDIAPIFHGLNK